MNKIVIALPKGRLAEQTLEILEKCNIKTDFDKDSRKLIFTDTAGTYNFIFVKPSDVPTYVERGVADIGVCGLDTIMEESRNVYELLDLGLGKCRICVCGYPDSLVKGKGGQLTVATKFVNIAKKYFDGKVQNVDMIKLNGSVELAPIMKLSDCIVDLVESGRTLKENNLEVLEVICDISARLIVNKVSLKTKSAVINPLVKKISGVL